MHASWRVSSWNGTLTGFETGLRGGWTRQEVYALPARRRRAEATLEGLLHRLRPAPRQVEASTLAHQVSGLPHPPLRPTGDTPSSSTDFLNLAPHRCKRPRSAECAYSIAGTLTEAVRLR